VETIGISQVALNSSYIERARDFVPKGITALGESVASYDAEGLFAKNTRTRDVLTYEVSDIILDSFWCALIKDNRIIGESRYLLPETGYKTLQIRPHQVIYVGGGSTGIVGYNWGHRNYYHWLIQSLPSLDWPTRGIQSQQNKTLVLPVLSEWQEESLSLLGINNIDRIEVDLISQYHFDTVEYSEYLGGSTAYSVSLKAIETFDRMKCGVSGLSSQTDRIYVARADTDQRKILNEGDVIDFLKSQGFRIVVPSEYCLADQIKIFHSAKLVVGGHGGGLSNLVFCQEGSWILELLQATYINPCFHSLAQARGLNYAAEVFTSVEDPAPKPANPLEIAWNLDMDVIRSRIDDITQRSRTQVGYMHESPSDLPPTPNEANSKQVKCHECGLCVRVLRTYLVDSHLVDWELHCDIHPDDLESFLSFCPTIEAVRQRRDGEQLPDCLFLNAAATRHVFSNRLLKSS
jgi:Glycosyltransferase 61